MKRYQTTQIMNSLSTDYAPDPDLGKGGAGLPSIRIPAIFSAGQ
jgi:hypothetical protein